MLIVKNVPVRVHAGWELFRKCKHKFIIPVKLFNVQPLQLLARLSVENDLRGLAWDLLEHSSVVLGLEVPVDEVLHLGELRNKQQIRISQRYRLQNKGKKVMFNLSITDRLNKLGSYDFDTTINM